MEHTEAPASPNGRRPQPDGIGRIGAVARKLRRNGEAASLDLALAEGGRSAQASRATGAGMHVLTDVIRGREAFLRLRKEWDEALEAGPDPAPALQHDVLCMWLENFAAGQEPLAFLARREGRIAAALGLTIGPGVVDGIPVTLARSWANAHSTRGGPLLGSDGIEALPGLVRRIREADWDVLHLRDVPREGDVLDTLTQCLRAQGFLVGFDHPMDSPYIPLPASFDDLFQRLDRHFRQNLRRRRRRLAEHGELGFEVVTGGDDLDAALEDALVIEAAGWKGHGGTAIRSRPDQVGFYSAWVRLLARDRRLRLCFLTVGGRRIAFHLGFVSRRRYWLPKCGFDESFRECSPGQLLMEDVLRRCMEERLEGFEFLGHAMPWKHDWTPLVHPHANLWAFRTTARGRAAHALRLRIRPRAARIVTATKERFGRTRAELDRAIGLVPKLIPSVAPAWMRTPLRGVSGGSVAINGSRATKGSGAIGGRR